MSEKASGVRIVTDLAIEMRQALMDLAGPIGWFENKKRWLERAARAAGISYRSAKTLFYCEAERPHTSVVESVRAAMRAKTNEREATARAEYQQLVAVLTEFEERLCQSDPDFHSPMLDVLRAQIHPRSRVGRSVDQGGDDKP